MAIADRRQREREQRRTDILDAAERLFFSRGYDEVSMDDISQDVELNRATLYLYFRNKEALFSAIVLRGFEILNRMYRECVDTQVTGITKVALMGSAFYRFTLQYPDYMRMIRYYGSERFRKVDLPETAAIKSAADDSRDLLCGAVSQGIADGTIRDDLDPYEITLYLMITFMSILSLDDKWKALIEGRGIRFEDFIRDFMRFITPAVSSGEIPHTVSVAGSEGPYASLFFTTDPIVIEKKKKK